MSTDSATSNQCTNQHAAAPNEGEEDDNDTQMLLALARENAALMRQVQILESLPDLIIDFNLNGRIFFASQSVLDFLGVTRPAEIEGTVSFWDMITLESKALIQRELGVVLAAHKMQGGHSVPLANGGILMVYVVFKRQDHEETHLVSLKGMVHPNENDLRCICSIRFAANRFHKVDSGTVVSNNGDSDEDGKV